MPSKEKAPYTGPRNAVVHSMKRRCAKHDYNAPDTYMVTIVTRGRQRLFGTLCGDPSKPLHTPGCAGVWRSDLGNAILKEEIPKINRYYPMVEVWKTCLMPDHLHFIIRVHENLPDRKQLGDIIKSFKQGCNKAYKRLFHIPNSMNAPLFEEGFCDKILHEDGQLDHWKNYLDDNPRRLIIKTANPDFFSRRHRLSIDGHECAAMGNIFLLDIPDKKFVVVHRRDTEEEYKRNVEAWTQCGENYGVLVGAFISEREKAVKKIAIEHQYPLILFTEEGMGPYYKPSGQDFDLCAEGRLLLVSPWPDAPKKSHITRQECLRLNELAEKIAAGSFRLLQPPPACKAGADGG